jgi:TolB-like protein/protein involved in temperature-dependent protein secretion
MPFQNLSDDGANEHFAIGIADGIVTNLQSWGAFPVIGRSATDHYRGTSPDLMTVASTLRVRYLLTGSVVAAQDGLRVTAKLVDGRDHSIVKALGPFDRPRLDVFDIQDEISDAIVTAIVPEVVRREMRPASLERPAELASWELVMRAQGLTLKGEYEDAREAESLLRIAIRREPGYAAAYARLAELGHNFSSTSYAKIIGDEEASQALNEALTNARTAVDLEPSLVDARIWYGHLLIHHRQIERGIDQLLEAVRLSPSHGQAHAELGFAYALSGNLDKAFQEFELSSRLSPNDPRSVRIQTFEALAYLYADKNQEALQAAQSILETNRGLAQSFYPYLVSISALVRLDRTDEARGQAEEFREQLGEFDWPAVQRGAWTEQQLELVRADFESIGMLPAS